MQHQHCVLVYNSSQPSTIAHNPYHSHLPSAPFGCQHGNARGTFAAGVTLRSHHKAFNPRGIAMDYTCAYSCGSCTPRIALSSTGSTAGRKCSIGTCFLSLGARSPCRRMQSAPEGTNVFGQFINDLALKLRCL